MIITKMIDMAMTGDAKKKYEGPAMVGGDSADGPLYPYGLCITLSDDELEKLDLDDDADVGDLIEGVFNAKITSISKRDTADGPCCRIELQITHLGLEDTNEDPNNEDD